MSKIKFAFLAFASAALFACGSQDGSSAELKDKNLGFISPFDTLTAEFDSKIVDINKLTPDNIEVGQNMAQVFPDGKTTSSKLYFIGTTDTTPGGLPFFKGGIINDSIVFQNLKNEDDYTTKRAVLYFSTQRILDKEPNGTPETAGDIDSLGTTTDGLVFAGVIDHKVGEVESGAVYDMSDYYTLEMRANDVLTITIGGGFRDSLKVQLTGAGIYDTTFTAKKKNLNVFTYTVGSAHLSPEDAFGKLVPFYINVKEDGNLSGAPNPYTVSILLLRK